MRALTLWQHDLMQAVIAQAQAKLSVLATAWSGGVAVSRWWPHQLLLGEILWFRIPSCQQDTGKAQSQPKKHQLDMHSW